MKMEAFLLAGGLLGCAGFVISLVCVAILAGRMNSTHTVQYVPHDNTEPLKEQLDLIEENEKALLDKVGKKKREQPTVIEDLDAAVAEVAQTDVTF